ncbi:MAG: MMPL family transporter [Actinomycetota bacterium]
MFATLGTWVSRRPGRTLALVASITVVLAGGFFVQDTPETSANATAAFLSADAEISVAGDKIAESFPTQSALSTTQIVVRGDVLAAEVLTAQTELAARIERDAAISPYLTPGSIVFPGEGGDAAPIARASDGTVLGGLILVTLNANDDPVGLERAELRIAELAEGAGTEAVDFSAVSQSVTNKENDDAQGSTTAILMLVALAVMVVLLAIFYRSGSDVALAFGGLLLTLVWTFGAQAWLSPGGLDVIAPGNPMTMMVPVMLIGLSVDYALQVSSRYREHLNEGRRSADAIRTSLAESGLPLALAAGTTAISFLTNVTSGFPAMADFGIVAALGLLFGFLAMITFVPATRTLLDRRRELRGAAVRSTAMADSIPGVGSALARVGEFGVRRPSAVLGGVVALTVVAGFGAANVSTTFSQRDFLPDGSDVVADLDFLEANVAGGSGTITVLLEDDFRSVRGVQNLGDFEDALANPELRPDGITGPPMSSPVTLILDWATDSGAADPRYDEGFSRYFAENQGLSIQATAAEIQATWDTFEAVDPTGFASVVDLRDDGLDRALLNLPVVPGDVELTRHYVEELEELWRGDDGTIVVTGNDPTLAYVTEALTASQTVSVALTIAAALLLLVAYFGSADFRPMLGVVVVVPIAVVLVWILGFMWLSGISYNMPTSIITALSIGIGVDYTIHLTHRFLEEQEHHESVGAAMARAMTTTGGALLASASTTVLGFLVLLLSPLPPMRQLGLLIAAVIVMSIIAAFLILPPLLALWALYHKWRATEFETESWHPGRATASEPRPALANTAR